MKTVYLVSLTLVFLFLSVGMVSAADPATLYVDANIGNDSNDGSPEHPWNTINHAADQVNPGDTVLISSGNYYITQNIYITTSGNQTNPVTFRGLGDGVVIDGSGLDGSSYEKRDAIFIDNADYVLIENLEIKNAYRAGIRVSEADYVTIRNVTSHDNGNWGIFTGFSNNLLIENCECYGSVNEHGIYTSNSGDNPTIQGNILHDNRGCGLHMNGDISMVGDGIISGALVENNIIYNNGVGGGSGINCDGVINSTIRNNLLYNNHASGISLYCIDGGSASNNNQIYQNTIIVASDGRWALNLKDGSSQNKIYNNILLNNNPSRGSITTDSITGLESDYNILSTNTHPVTPDDESTYPTFSQWQAMGFDQHSMQANPINIFTNSSMNDYTLKKGSVAIDNGTSLYASSKDILGNTRPKGDGYDIGAYEYVTNFMGVTNSRTGISYSTIQAAIDDSNTIDNDTLCIDNQNYYENVNLYKRLTIIALGTVLQAYNHNLPALTISSAGSGSTLEGFAIMGATGSSGIFLNNSISCIINNNTITANNIGILVMGNENNLTNNNASSNGWAGICLSGVSLNTVVNNVVSGNPEGIYILDCNINSFSGNIADGNTFNGLNIVGGGHNTLLNNIVSNNGVSTNGNGVILKDTTFNILDGNLVGGNGWSGIVMDNSSNNTLMDVGKGGNTINGNGNGLVLFNGCENNIMVGNNLIGNLYNGLQLFVNCKYNQIHDNIILNTHVTGLLVQLSDNNNLTGNTVNGSVFNGVALDNANNNTFDANSITGSGSIGLIVVNGNYNTITHNQLNSTFWTNIAMYQSSFNLIQQNTITGAGISQNGIWFQSNCNYNNITTNNIIGNTANGINIQNSLNNLINYNNVTSNGVMGLIMFGADNTVINHNTFQDNGFVGTCLVDGSTGNTITENNYISSASSPVQAYDTGTNNYDNGTTGNYWNEWAIPDPRPIAGGSSVDNYPSSTPF